MYIYAHADGEAVTHLVLVHRHAHAQGKYILSIFLNPTEHFTNLEPQNAMQFRNIVHPRGSKNFKCSVGL